MNALDPTRRREPFFDVAGDGVASAPRKPAAAQPPEVPHVSDSSAVFVATAAQAAATGPRLDAFLDSTAPTYHTREGDVRVPAPYRWPFNQGALSGYDDAPAGVLQHREATVARNMPDLRALAARAGISPADLRLLQHGGGDPTQVRRLTQSLIDAGKLPDVARSPYDGAPATRDLGARVRQMMADNGLGFDEGGYVRQAIAHLDPTKTALAPVSLAAARPGDVFARAPGVPVAILRSQRAASTAEEAALRRAPGFATGRIVGYDVDSSHGSPIAEVAGGGVARETWWHDEQSGVWLAPGGLAGTAVPFDAVYRPVAPRSNEP